MTMNDYRIRSDAVQVMVEMKTTVKKGALSGQEKWVVLSYHSTMAHAVRWLLERAIRDGTSTDGCGWQEVLVALEKAHKSVQEVVRG